MANPRLDETPADFEQVDLVDPRTFSDHDLAGFWRRLRDTRPVYWHPAADGHAGFWVLSRYADILAVYRDNKAFTSERGNVLGTLLTGGDSAAGRMLAVTDGRRHKEVRNVLLKAFSPRALWRVSDRVRENSRALMAEAVERRACDFASDIAGVIPMATICDLLGVPAADREFLLERTKAALSSEARTDGADAQLARNELLLYFGDLVERRRAVPSDDIVSTLTQATIDGEPLREEEIIFNCYSLIIGGDETSRLTMIDAIHTLAAHPAQWELLRRGVVSLERAVEEALRWATPTMHFGRTAVRDVEIGGTTVRAGDIVTLWNTSANRDEAVFAEPGRFDLARSPNKHVAFGYGPHFCLGAYLARVEITEMLSALRTFASGFEIVGEVRRLYSNVLAGIVYLPVHFEPA